MFVILGVATLVFLGLWLLLFSKPEESKWLSPEERDFIVRERDSSGQREVAGNVSHMSRADVFRSPTSWGLVLASGAPPIRSTST